MFSHKLNLFILFLIVVNIKGDYVSNLLIKLTTAKRLQEALPRPTKFVRNDLEEESQSDVGESLNVPSLYASKGPARRKGVADVWSWEHWCELQPKAGNCSDRLERYYYNTQIDQCMNYTYSGCGGNNNSFESLQKCERFCSGAPYESLKDDVSYFCEIQPDVGICLDLMTKYYYDVNENRCKEFQYGGCGGNRNRFDTRSSCLAACGGSPNLRKINI